MSDYVVPATGYGDSTQQHWDIRRLAWLEYDFPTNAWLENDGHIVQVLAP